MLEPIHPEIVCDLGEGPRWDAATGTLRWTDLHRARLHAAPWKGRARTVDVGRHLPLAWTATLSAAVPVAGPPGGLVAVAGNGLVHLPAGGGARALRPLVPPGTLRFTGAACDPSGRLWAGAMDRRVAQGAGLLMRIGPGGAVRALTGLTAPNGLAWSPDGRTMYVTDARPGTITAHPFDPVAGAVGRPRTVVRLAPAEGVPDGLAVDVEGCLWTATWTGRQVRRYTPGGRLLTALDVPADRVAACAFAGPDLGTLVVTTGRVPGASLPGSGRLYAAVPGVRGLPGTPYAGPLPG
ncbi:SMP-30/gluconolactonase/LRE family protein [Actinomadura parmotrematis]|uniref:SMP-30/gluconolactonase/LRE family protein n=1 Tax=Actinomadura parmotrematis TaxID=2864039 RepID=A0ABS7FPM6_9ACTN|nr:SMP-30/gluconolactonase/LRE family protein [Actinomadura parmotrematis]MBW8482358.1 SMP-30/gluconolactonase/LRE family protein [Actinomadura parmotrematis]